MPLILNRLTELKVSHVLAVRFVPMPVTEARKEMHSAVLDFRGAASFNRGFVDPDMLDASQQAVTAFGKAAAIVRDSAASISCLSCARADAGRGRQKRSVR